MRFNHKAFFFGFFGLIFLNAIYAILLWLIAKNFFVQFEETLFIYKLSLYAPPLLINIVWLGCTIKLFENGPITPIVNRKLSNAIATPLGTTKGNLVESFKYERHKTKTSVLIGSVIAINISFFAFFKTLDILYVYEITTIYNSKGYVIKQFKNDIKSLQRERASVALIDFSEKLRGYLSSNSNINQMLSQNSEVGKWKNIFTSNLACFAEEKALFDSAKKNEDVIFSNPNDLIMLHEIRQLEDYEYWIDPENVKHFKLRFHKPTNSLTVIYSLPSVDVLYNPNNKTFVEDSRSSFWDLDYGYFVYDSETDEYRFEYEGFWENFFEHQKWIFYAVWYLFGFGICILIIKIMRKLALSNFFNKKVLPKTYNTN